MLLVNLGQVQFNYRLPAAKLPAAFFAGGPVAVRDVWRHRDLPTTPLRGGTLAFEDVAPHDSVFYVLRPVSP